MYFEFELLIISFKDTYLIEIIFWLLKMLVLSYTSKISLSSCTSYFQPLNQIKYNVTYWSNGEKQTLVYGAKLFYLYKLDKTTETICISPKSFGEVKLKINK
jgi:hypothetical protein